MGLISCYCVRFVEYRRIKLHVIPVQYNTLYQIRFNEPLLNIRFDLYLMTKIMPIKILVGCFCFRIIDFPFKLLFGWRGL